MHQSAAVQSATSAPRSDAEGRLLSSLTGALLVTGGARSGTRITLQGATGVKVVDNVYLVPRITANPYLIVDEDGLTLIDAGLPGSHKMILSYIARLGKTPYDVKRIILTHSDLDHVGGLAAIHKATGARTFASQIEAEAIALGRSSKPTAPGQRISLVRRVYRTLFKAKPQVIDEVVTDGQVLPVLGGLRVLDTAGHAPGHISLFAPAAGVLFCGDSMVGTEQGLRRSRPQMTWNSKRAAEAVARQAALKPRIVCPGHGPVVMDAAAKFPQ
jgi:glyoxylase-like metal-dependent hydrolase (beta-lactamase superfamily II)